MYECIYFSRYSSLYEQYLIVSKKCWRESWDAPKILHDFQTKGSKVWLFLAACKSGPCSWWQLLLEGEQQNELFLGGFIFSPQLERFKGVLHLVLEEYHVSSPWWLTGPSRAWGVLRVCCLSTLPSSFPTDVRAWAFSFALDWNALSSDFFGCLLLVIWKRQMTRFASA